jgi:anaerobic selenocysteine-containing dehydrogenase
MSTTPDTSTGTATTDERTFYRTCPLCEATCGVEITVEGDQVKQIRGDDDDVMSGGFICPKGTTLGALHEDPDRLRAPLIKRDGKHVEVSWDEAFAFIAKRTAEIRDEFGDESFAAYLGNPNVHNMAGAFFVRPVLQALRSRTLFSASTVDQMPRHVSCGLMYGNPDTIPVPDIDRTQYMLMLGANPVESNGSLCTAPDFPGRLKKLRQRGGTLVVVDPRTTRTAKLADRHLAIRPGTDAHLLLSITHVLFEEDLASSDGLDDLANGYAELQAAVSAFTPAAVAMVTGIEADAIRTLAREIAAADSATVYGRMGAHTTEFGTLASWAADMICAITGNFDRPGGLMFPYSAPARPRREGPGRGFSVGRWTSRVRQAPEVRGELPVATMAEEIETEGQGQVRALVTIAGNPALSAPNADRLEKAFSSLAFMVSVDPYLNETTRNADVVLPPPSVLERSHFDLSFTSLAVRNFANYSPVVFEPTSISEPDILARLALALNGADSDVKPSVVHDMLLRGLIEREVASERSVISGRDPEEIFAAVAGLPPSEAMLDVMLRTGPYGDGFGKNADGLSLEKLVANPHGIDLGPLEPAVPQVISTASGLIELLPTAIADDIARLRADLSKEISPSSMQLIGRRTVRSNNSWMHNVGSLMKGRDRCTLQIHPDDATRLGLENDSRAKVTSSEARRQFESLDRRRPPRPAVGQCHVERHPRDR